MFRSTPHQEMRFKYEIIAKAHVNEKLRKNKKSIRQATKYGGFTG